MDEPLAGSLFRLANEYKRQLSHQLSRDRWVQASGFRPPCVGVLKVIDTDGPVSQREISDALALDPSDLVGVLDILEDGGLIERRRDPADRRRNAVVTTAQGRKVAARVQELAAGVEEAVLARLDTRERTQLASLIERALGT